MCHDVACRKDWEGLDLKTLKWVFNSLRRADVAAKDIPNVVLRSLYGEFLKIHDAKFQALAQCFDEQAQHRSLRAQAVPAAHEEAPPPVADVDHSDKEVWAVAKATRKFWFAAAGKN